MYRKDSPSSVVAPQNPTLTPLAMQSEGSPRAARPSQAEELSPHSLSAQRRKPHSRCQIALSMDFRMKGEPKFECGMPGCEGETAEQLWRDERQPSDREGLQPGTIKPAQGPRSAWPERRETRNPSPPQELHLLLLRDKFKTRIGQNPVSTKPRLSEREALQRAQPPFLHQIRARSSRRYLV